jgi:hypothetical protein
MKFLKTSVIQVFVLATLSHNAFSLQIQNTINSESYEAQTCRFKSPASVVLRQLKAVRVDTYSSSDDMKIVIHPDKEYSLVGIVDHIYSTNPKHTVRFAIVIDEDGKERAVGLDDLEFKSLLKTQLKFLYTECNSPLDSSEVNATQGEKINPNQSDAALPIGTSSAMPL